MPYSSLRRGSRHVRGPDRGKLSQRIGHASPAFTLTRYGHLMPGMDEHAADVVGDAVFG
jgi:hypothetical protein